jgi:hypothetical protein
VDVIRQYLRNVLVGFDQLVNAIFGGDPDETLSSRLQRHRRENEAASLIADALDTISPGHCADSLEPDDHHQNEIWR